MTGQQGWDLAEFRCSRCGTRVLATAEREFVKLVADHKANCPTTKDAR